MNTYPKGRPKLFHVFFAIFVICLSLGLESCANHISKIPPEWPSTINSVNNGCNNLSGTYINRAIEAPNNKEENFHRKNPRWAIYLSKLLVPYIPDRDIVEHRSVDTIELEGVDKNQLKISFKQKEKIIYTKLLSTKADFTCTSQALILENVTSPNNMMGISKEFSTISISKAVDGSIVASKKETEIGTIVVMPYREQVIQYYRFIQKDREQTTVSQ